MEPIPNVERGSGQDQGNEEEQTGEAIPKPSTTSASFIKRKRKCIRLDIGHHRNIFVSTFYRIWMYRKRHVMLTLLQLLIPPLVLIGMTAYLGKLLHPKMKGWSTFDLLSEEALYSKIGENAGHEGVIYCHVENNDTQFAQKFVPKLKAKFSENNITLQLVDERGDMLKEYIHYHLKGEAHKYIAGIAIKNPPSSSNRREDEFKLKFSVAMAQKTPGFYFKQRPLFFSLEKNMPEHYYALLGIELTVCRTFYKLIQNETNSSLSGEGITKTKERDGIALEVQSLPYPPHPTYSTKEVNDSGEVNDDSNELDSMLATIFVLSLVPVFFTVVEGPVTEKENGFKLYLLLMGYPRGAYWFSWILNQMIIQLVVIGLQVWLIFIPFDPNTGPLIRYGDVSLWVFVLVLFNFSSLSFFVFLAAFFRRGKMATYLGILIWLLSFHLLQSHIPSFDFGSGLTPFMLSCLIPSACIHWVVFILTTINTNTWKASLSFELTQESGFSLADVILMMIVDFFLYLFLTLYVDNLKPGPLEAEQPWNYFFEGIRCRFIDPNRDFIDKHNLLSSGKRSLGAAPDDRFHLDLDKKPAIEFQKISKKFRSTAGVFGIENVKFTAYAQQITVLLGHKDSGRTTLMRLLCGEYSPTSGTALVFGYNVRKNTQKAQSFLSVCLEHNSLCEYLTVLEHMLLIGKLKGQGTKAATAAATKILKSLDLLGIINDKMWKLVHWQRRVLCIAMAFMGNAPVLLLDDPTKHLDLDVKRQIWSLLTGLKENGRTILMSTSDIDEAYQVADRIVIMSRGRVAGVGPPNRLEYIFETGYHLSINVLPDSDKEEIFSFLQQIIPSIRELEGGFSQVKKAIQFTDWDLSLACLPDLLPGLDSGTPSTTTRDNPDAKSNFSKLLSFFGFSSESQDDEVKEESKATIVELNNRTSKRLDLSMEGIEMNYLLSFGDEETFPKLFKALDNSGVIHKLGIKKYELKLHDMEKAFSEVDDYVDVLNAADGSDIDLEDFVDIKGFRTHIDDHADSAPPLPVSGGDKVTTFWYSVWALIVKRLYHMIGNFGHVSIQVLAPVLILCITIQSINTHFQHRLISHEIPFNISTESSVPDVSYRMGSGNLSKAFLHSYKEVISKRPNNLEKLTNIGNISKFQEFYKDIDDYRLRLHDELLFAADFSKLDVNESGGVPTVVALFSPGQYHSAALSLLLMFNAILDYEFPEHKYSVEMMGSSMSHTRETIFLPNSTFSDMVIMNSIDITLTVSLAFGYFIFTSGFVSHPCSERLNQLKRYQMYTLKWNGLYWVANGIIDLFFNIIPITLLTIIIYYQPSHDVFKNHEFIILFVITGTLGGFASILSSYFWSHFLLKTETSYYAVLSINQFLGLFVFLLYSIINFEYIGDYARTIVVFCLQTIQPFTIPLSFHSAILWALENARCVVLHETVKEEMCSSERDGYDNIQLNRGTCCSDESTGWSFQFIWQRPRLLSKVAFLLGHCGVWILILMYMETRRLRRKIFHYNPHSDKPPEIKNQRDAMSLMAEEKLVEETSDGKEKDKVFIIRNVGTSSSRRILLYPMSFCCEAGKCTAVVGPETSGITVLYTILSGIRAVSDGEVTFGGYSLLSSNSRKKFLYQLGLCPVRDITIDKITGLQFLKLFGRLRDISPKDLPTHVDHWVKALGLEKVIKDKCINYSIITKRKLAVAAAVIGNPQVIIFDEPTKDLDPLSRYQVGKVLESLVRADRIVIILTHDLSSIEKFCNKLIFLVNGQMKFCESTDAVIKDTSKDFTLIVRLKSGDADEHWKFDVKSYVDLKSNIQSDIAGVALLEEQSHMLVYRIKHENANWGNIFESVGKIVAAHSDIVSEYHVRRTSLQDVYNSYSVNQRVFRIHQSAWDEFRTTYC